jgi:hypothetical protein
MSEGLMAPDTLAGSATTGSPRAWSDGHPGPLATDAEDGELHPTGADLERLRAELTAAESKIQNLEIALHTSRRIGAAIGVLMAQRHISQDAAFDLMRVASQTRHRKLRDIAEEVLYTGALDPTPAKRTSGFVHDGSTDARRDGGLRNVSAPPAQLHRARAAESLTGAQSDLGRPDTKGSAGQPAPAEPAH